MSEQKTVCHTHSANTNVKPMSAQLHQHRLLSEVNFCKFQVESSHLVVIALAVDWFEFVRMTSDAIPSYAVFFFVLENWIQKTTKFDNCVLPCDRGSQLFIEVCILVSSNQNLDRI